MNKIIRIAALGAAVCVAGAMIASCGNSGKHADRFAVISESSEKALAAVKAEMVVDENIKIEQDITGVLENRSSYTHIQYEKGDTLVFSLNTEDGSSNYELFTTDEGIFEIRDGKGGLYNGETPDFDSYIALDFELKDIKDISVEYGEKGTKLYTVTMKASYADNFDSEMNGGEYDCTAVTYVYQIDSLTRLKSVTSEYTADFTYEGSTRNTVKKVAVQFAEVTN